MAEGAKPRRDGACSAAGLQNNAGGRRRPWMIRRLRPRFLNLRIVFFPLALAWETSLVGAVRLRFVLLRLRASFFFLPTYSPTKMQPDFFSISADRGTPTSAPHRGGDTFSRRFATGVQKRRGRGWVAAREEGVARGSSRGRLRVSGRGPC